MAVKRKKKICNNCHEEKYLFGLGMCKYCYNKVNAKPIKKISTNYKKLLEDYAPIRKQFLRY